MNIDEYENLIDWLKIFFLNIEIRITITKTKTCTLKGMNNYSLKK